jgi:hypothetical protein
MNPLTILQLAIQWGPTVKAIVDEAESNDTIIQKVSALSPTLAKLLESVGAEFFPKAAPALHVVGGVLAAFDPNTTKWLQGALNVLLTPSPNLTVDGIYGAHTRTAVEELQTKLGLTPDGIAGQITQAAIASALAKLGTLK